MIIEIKVPDGIAAVILPTQIELGSYSQLRKVKFNKDNPKHIKMFEKFYGVNELLNFKKYDN